MEGNGLEFLSSMDRRRTTTGGQLTGISVMQVQAGNAKQMELNGNFCHKKTGWES